MAVGTFFKSSEDNEVTNNSQIFYYLPYREKNGNYPFFIAFTEDKVNFYFAGSEDDNLYLPPTLIFSLHLYNDKHTKKELAEVLIDAHSNDYSSIKVQDFDNEEKGFKLTDILQKFDLKEQSEKSALYSNLLLDFLYDEKHSEVFYEANYFGKIQHLLKESEFTQAIALKAEFYYQFEMLKSEYDYEDKFGIEKVKNALINWIGFLQEHNIHKTIKPKNNWFNDVETEMALALDFEKKSVKENHSIIKKEIKELKKEKKIFKNKKSIDADEKGKLKKIKYNLYRKKSIKEEFEKLEKESHHQRKHTTSWFIDRNNILRAWLFNGSFERGVFWASLILISLTILFFIKTVFIKTVFIKSELISVISNLSIYIPLVVFPLITIISGICFIKKDKLEIKGEILPKKIIQLIKYLMLPLWALVFGATHIVFNTQSFYNKLFVKNLWTADVGIFLLGLLFTIITYKIAYRWSTKRIPQKLLRSIIFFGSYIIYILLISICFSVNLISHFHSVIISLSLSLFLFGMLFFHEKESHPNISEATSANKTLSMLFYGLIISFFINVFYINTEYKEYLERYEYLGHIWHHTQKEYAFSDKDKDGYFSFSEVKENYTGEYDLEINDAPKQHIKLHSTSKPVKDKDYYSYFYVYEPKDSSYQNDRSKFIVSKENLKKRLKIKKNELVSLSEKLKKVRVQLDNSKNGLDSIQQHNFNQLSDDSLNVVDKIKKDSIQLNKKIKYFNKKFFLKYIKVKKSIYQPLSDDIEVTIDKYFFKELQNVYLYKQKEFKNNDGQIVKYYKRSKVPVIKEINLFGIKIITIPNILFINTFLSLFIAVILQIFIHKTKFLKGGSGHGH